MNIILNPCTCEIYNGHQANAFVEVTFKNGKLSLHGVIGPTSNGNCKGSCGQIQQEIRKGIPNEKDGWTQELLSELCDVWAAWHLNDMHPECKHQRALGWNDTARTQVKIYNWELNHKTLKQQREAEQAALSALKTGVTFTPTAEQTKIAQMPYTIKTYTEELPQDKKDYYIARKQNSFGRHVEIKSLSNLYPKEHPDGILAKSCPVCGYKYGTAWKTVEVPQQVTDWLFALPESTKTPAWV